MNEFTILQSVYQKDSPVFLSECFQSIFQNTVQPHSIVLVKDGPITLELQNIIDIWQKKLPLNVVGYPQNRGLAFALDFGLKYVTTELTARMDSDDICNPERFAKQINFMSMNPDIVITSSYVNEFYKDPSIIEYVKKVPLEYKSIKNYLRKRNAFNHMSVMFRKSAIIEAGSYQDVPYFEDFDLWIRLIQKGFKAKNMKECLLSARIGNNMVGRRHGVSYAKQELFFLRRQLKSGFLSKTEYILLCILRIPLRLLPLPFLKIIYRFLRSSVVQERIK